MKNIINLPIYRSEHRPVKEILHLDYFYDHSLLGNEPMSDLYRINGLGAVTDWTEHDIDEDTGISEKQGKVASADYIAEVLTEAYTLCEGGLHLEGGDLFYSPDDGGCIVIATRIADREKVAA